MGTLPINESMASAEDQKPPNSVALGLLPRFGRLDMSQHFIQLAVIKTGQRAEGIRSLTYPLPDSGWHLVGQQEQLFFIGVENVSQFVDEFLGWVITKVEILVLDLRDVRVAHTDLRRQSSFGQPPLHPKLMNSFAKLHFRITFC